MEFISVVDGLPSASDLNDNGQVLAVRKNGDIIGAWFANNQFRVGFRQFTDIVMWAQFDVPTDVLSRCIDKSNRYAEVIKLRSELT